MRMRALLASLMLTVSPLALADIEYHGFHIDDRQLDAGQREAFTASITGQLDIVERANLPPAMLDFFRQTRIEVDASIKGNPGVFRVDHGAGAVFVRPEPFPANKPILLHELLHAYHFNVLGLRSQPILDGFAAASKDGVYPAGFHRAHFLENAKEYFAVTGTIYLVGEIQQPPFNCAVLAKNDASYLAFMAATFGPHDCK